VLKVGDTELNVRQNVRHGSCPEAYPVKRKESGGGGREWYKERLKRKRGENVQNATKALALLEDRNGELHVSANMNEGGEAEKKTTSGRPGGEKDA